MMDKKMVHPGILWFNTAWRKYRCLFSVSRGPEKRNPWRLCILLGSEA
jgi:hypothetical protein